ncbi:hypothetical protein EJ02DRAFT_338600 [Clathrospora elynae]|uniref:HAD-like protein n=1 Tax=Clathrospora elynae TaxID=706981 RepID=A0A6A5T3S6_9PLEO|nr:hypothetical protein EJ02DRAFT_338600 [Clathrospora elynae]
MSTRPPFSPRKPIQWVVDWDGTITKQDTLNALVNISAATKPDFPILHIWERVSQAYLDDYTDTLEKLAPGGALPTTIEQEKELLQKLKNVEQRSLNRVSSSGIFAGVTRTGLETGARQAITSHQVELRAGFPSFIHLIQGGESNGNKFCILSVNWSCHFIHSCLRASGISIAEQSIMANEIDKTRSGTPSTGCIVATTTLGETTIISSGDKLQRLERIRESQSDVKAIVYVGDSWTDIECLLAADLGICIRDDPMGSSQRKLHEAFERLSVKCPHISDWKERDEWKVVWARDFDEVRAWMESETTAV